VHHDLPRKSSAKSKEGTFPRFFDGMEMGDETMIPGLVIMVDNALEFALMVLVAEPVLGQPVLPIRRPAIMQRGAKIVRQNPHRRHRLFAAFAVNAVIGHAVGTGDMQPMQLFPHSDARFIKMHHWSLESFLLDLILIVGQTLIESLGRAKERSLTDRRSGQVFEHCNYSGVLRAFRQKPDTVW